MPYLSSWHLFLFQQLLLFGLGLNFQTKYTKIIKGGEIKLLTWLIAGILGVALSSGGSSKEKEEKKRLEKLERTRETRKKYYEDNNLNEQYNNIKRKI